MDITLRFNELLPMQFAATADCRINQYMGPEGRLGRNMGEETRLKRRHHHEKRTSPGESKDYNKSTRLIVWCNKPAY